VKRHAFFCTRKGSLGGDERPVLALKSASSITGLVIKSILYYVSYILQNIVDAREVVFVFNKMR